MCDVPGLIIIVAGSDPARFHAALSVAAANAALGGRSRVFLQGEAAGLLRILDRQEAAEGTPTLTELIEETVALGGEIMVCQSGLALVDLSAEDLPESLTTSGLVELLAGRGDDQLMIA